MSTPHHTGSPSYCNKADTYKRINKSNKGTKIRIKGIKLLLFAADEIIYIENPEKLQSNN